MEYLGFAISILALVLSGYTYFKHDQKIKKQEKILNDYQINEIESKRIESRKAKIEATVVKNKDWQNAIKVYNKGQAIARNVNVKIENNDGFRIRKNPCPIDVKPQHSFEIILFLSTNYPEKIKLNLEWDDDLKEKNCDQQFIQLL